MNSLYYAMPSTSTFAFLLGFQLLITLFVMIILGAIIYIAWRIIWSSGSKNPDNKPSFLYSFIICPSIPFTVIIYGIRVALWSISGKKQYKKPSFLRTGSIMAIITGVIFCLAGLGSTDVYRAEYLIKGLFIIVLGTWLYIRIGNNQRQEH